MKRMICTAVVCLTLCAAALFSIYAIDTGTGGAPVLTETLTGTVLAASDKQYVLQTADAGTADSSVSSAASAVASGAALDTFDTLRVIAAGDTDMPAVGDVVDVKLQITPSGSETALSCTVTGAQEVDKSLAASASDLLANMHNTNGKTDTRPDGTQQDGANALPALPTQNGQQAQTGSQRTTTQNGTLGTNGSTQPRPDANTAGSTAA